jgi:hypothetical protein
MELKADSRAELGFPQGTLLPIIRSPGPDEALQDEALQTRLSRRGSPFNNYVQMFPPTPSLF